MVVYDQKCNDQIDFFNLKKCILINNKIENISLRLRCVKRNKNFPRKTFSNSSIFITLYNLEANLA